MKTIALILSAILLFGCAKTKQPEPVILDSNRIPWKLNVDVTGDSITKVLKGNVYCGTSTFTFQDTFTTEFHWHTAIAFSNSFPLENDLYVVYRWRNANITDSTVSISVYKSF